MSSYSRYSNAFLASIHEFKFTETTWYSVHFFMCFLNVQSQGRRFYGIERVRYKKRVTEEYSYLIKLRMCEAGLLPD